MPVVRHRDHESGSSPAEFRPTTRRVSRPRKARRSSASSSASTSSSTPITTYVLSIADALGIDHFALMGHSGGAPHALACGALLPERVLGVVVVAGLAPFGAEGLEWFAGMTQSGAAELRAAAQGRAALEDYLESTEFDPEMFTPADHAALSGAWSWLNSVVGPAMEAGPGGFIDDDLAYGAAWGFDPAQVIAPTLFLHGGRDRVVPSTHSEWLARRCPSAELWLCPDDGHISVLGSSVAAMAWLREHADEWG